MKRKLSLALCFFILFTSLSANVVKAENAGLECKRGTLSFENAPESIDADYYVTQGGHRVTFTETEMFVDGVPVDFNWSFTYDLLYTRIQNFTVTDSTRIDASTYQNGSFVDGQNMNRSSDCIRVKINNFTMKYFCNSPYGSWTKTFGQDDWTYFYVDAETGKTIGTDANYYHTDMGITNSFHAF